MKWTLIFLGVGKIKINIGRENGDNMKEVLFDIIKLISFCLGIIIFFMIYHFILSKIDKFFTKIKIEEENRKWDKRCGSGCSEYQEELDFENHLRMYDREYLDKLRSEGRFSKESYNKLKIC